jgi:hypothetical protein
MKCARSRASVLSMLIFAAILIVPDRGAGGTALGTDDLGGPLLPGADLLRPWGLPPR